MEQFALADTTTIILAILLLMLAVFLVLAITFLVYAIRMLKNFYSISKAFRNLTNIVNEDFREAGKKILKDENVKKIVKSGLLWVAGFLRVIKRKRSKK